MSSFQTEIINEVEHGRNHVLQRCYLDTCVLLNGFMTKTGKISAEEQTQINDAKEFFTKYDGPNLFISPMVIAEFIHVVTNPNKGYALDYNTAISTIEQIIDDEKVSILVPKIDIRSEPEIKFRMFSSSLQLIGKCKHNGNDSEVRLLCGQLGDSIGILTGGINPPSFDFAKANTQWETLILGSAFYDLLISVARESTSASGGPLQLQDALVLSLARGQKYLIFLTQDKTLEARSGRHPYLDVEVRLVRDYIDNNMKTATGSYKL